MGTGGEAVRALMPFGNDFDAVDDPVGFAVRHYPEGLAWLDEQGSMTWGEVDEVISRMAGSLAANGKREGDRIGVCCSSPRQGMLAVFAVIRLGGAAVMLDFRLPVLEAESRGSQAGASLMLVDKECSVKGTLPAELKGGISLPSRAMSSAQPATIVFTSGSSALPKAAILTLGNLRSSACGVAERLGRKVLARWVLTLPIAHVGGLSVLFRAAWTGTSILAMPQGDQAGWDQFIRLHRGTGISVVPTQLARWMEASSRPPPPSLKAVVVGGAPLSQSLQGKAQALGFPLLTTYGLTECASQVTTLSLSDSHRGQGGRTAGRALEGTTVAILDAQGRPLPPQHQGEIAVKGPTVFAGYVEEGSRVRTLPGGWLGTGDLGWVDSEGFLTVTGRMGDMILTGGENVHPAEVEAGLLSLSGVTRAAAMGIPDPLWGQRVVALVEAEEGRDGESLRQELRGKLAGYQIPKEIKIVPALPLTPLGKTKRSALLQCWNEAHGESSSSPCRSTPTPIRR